MNTLSTNADVSERSVTYDKTTIVYQFLRKHVRNINLRINQDGSVHVSANTRQSLKDVDAFVQSKGRYIIAAQKQFRIRAEQAPQPHQYVNGEQYSIAGQELLLIVVGGKPCGVSLRDGCIILTVRNPDDSAEKKKLMDKWIEAQSKELLTQIVAETYPLFQKYNIPFPETRVRSMKSRWGTCLMDKGIITLNSELIFYPRESIEYVVLHEYCHFLQPNHSKKFYALVAS